MTPKSIFQLIVRLLGLYLIYQAALLLPQALYSPPVSFIFGLQALYYLLLGWWLIGGAPLLTRRAYPSE